MRDILLIVGMCLAAIIIGSVLFFAAPDILPQPSVEPGVTSVGAETNTPEAVKVPFTVLVEGSTALNVSARKNYVVRGQEEFENLWRMVYGDGAPALPKVDFTKQDVIAVFAGEKGSGGHRIAVSAVNDYGDARSVSVTLTSPGAGCVNTQAITSPYQIVTVPASGSSLSHTDVTVIEACD